MYRVTFTKVKKQVDKPQSYLIDDKEFVKLFNDLEAKKRIKDELAKVKTEPTKKESKGRPDFIEPLPKGQKKKKTQ